MGNGASIGGSRATSRTSGTAATLQRQPVLNDIVPLRRPTSTINEEDNSEEEEIDLPENLQRVVRAPEQSIQHNTLSSRGSTQGTSIAQVSATHKVFLVRLFERLSNLLSVTFNIDFLQTSAISKPITAGELILTAGTEPTGVHIVMDGVVSIMDPTGHVILGHLSQGDSFGEVETFMNCSCCMTIQSKQSGTLVYIPKTSVILGINGTINNDKMRDWCIERGYINTNGLFNDDDITLSIIISALQVTIPFKSWSIKSLQYMARLCILTLFDEGSILTKYNEPSTHIYILVRGKIEVVEEQSQTYIVNYTSDSCSIGDKDCFLKNPRKQTMRVLTPSLVIPVTKDVVIATLEKFVEERQYFQRTLKQYREMS